MAHAQGTAFTYQGRLNADGSPVNGLFDFRFKLYVDPVGDTQVGASYLTNGVPTTNGLFITTIDFGPGIFTGGTNWLEVDVRTNGAGSYTLLSPFQVVTPTPNAIFAGTASIVSGPVSAAQISGTLANSVLPASPSFSGTAAANSFSGNGANLSNVNAVALNGLSSSNFWQLGGNTVSTGQFLGSTNHQSVVVEVNGQEAVRYEPTTDTPNVVGGYASNSVQAGLVGVTIGGGGAVGGYQPNIVTNYANYAVIAGGYANTVTNYAGAILGGSDNFGGGWFSVTAGGQNQTNLGTFSFIGGGEYNTIQTNVSESTIAGGYDNSLQTYADGSVIGGGFGNSILGDEYFSTNYATIASTIAGGVENSISSNNIYATIGGGGANLIQAGDGAAIIGGGEYNSMETNSPDTFIGGGYNNTIQINAGNALIAGGSDNIIQSNSAGATIGGGSWNLAGGSGAVIPGGYGNIATGVESFAAGTTAQATNTGSFVLADYESTPFASTTTNQLSARFNGGIRFVTEGAGLTLDGQPVLVGSNGTGLTNVNASTFNGLASTAFAPAAGSSSYIQNQFANPQFGALNITGIAAAGGASISGTVTANNVVATNNLQINCGTFQVLGAGSNTLTTAFVQYSTAANISGDHTIINNPLCNGDPNAILIVTHNYNPGSVAGVMVWNHVIGTYYTGGQWTLYNEDLSTMSAGVAFNVLVIKH